MPLIGPVQVASCEPSPTSWKDAFQAEAGAVPKAEDFGGDSMRELAWVRGAAAFARSPTVRT